MIQIPTASPISKNHLLKIAAIAGFIFIAWRLSIFIFTHPIYLLNDPEELYRGTVARELALRTLRPLWEYRPDNYAGGFYVVTQLLSLSQKLFNFSWLGLKSFAILHTSATMLIWYWVLARAISVRSALIFCALYTFSPFLYIHLSSKVLGDHAETSLLSALAVWIFFRLLQNPQSPKRLYSGFTLGMLSGFGFWFAYIYGLTLAAFFLYLLINNRKFFFDKKLVLSSIAGFAAGFSFWIGFNASHHFTGIILHESPIWELFDLGMLFRPFTSWQDFFIIKLIQGRELTFNWVEPRNLLSWFYLTALIALFVVSIVGLIKPRGTNSHSFRKSPVGLALLYTSVFLIAQQTFESVGLRFMIPLFPFFLVIVACTLANISRKHMPIAAVLFCTVISINFIACVTRFDFSYTKENLLRKGYSAKTLAFTPNIRPRIVQALKNNFQSLTKTDRMSYITAFVAQLSLEPSTLADEIKRNAGIIPEEYSDYYTYFLGWEIYLRNPDPIKSFELIRPLRGNDSHLYNQLFKGIMDAHLGPGLPTYESEIEGYLPEDLKNRIFIYEGYSFAMSELLHHGNLEYLIDRLKAKLERLDPKPKICFLRGVGRCLFSVWEDNPLKPVFEPHKITTFPEDVRPYVYQGIAHQMLKNYALHYRSRLIWNWTEFSKSFDSHEISILVTALKVAADKWGFPQNGIPYDRLARAKEFW